jgi:hypothetical protein
MTFISETPCILDTYYTPRPPKQGTCCTARENYSIESMKKALHEDG